MALKGNPFDKKVIGSQLPITGTRAKPKFEKIELGAVPPPSSFELSSPNEKAERKYGETEEKVESEQERKYGETEEKVERSLLSKDGQKEQSREKVVRKVESEQERKYGETEEKVERKYPFSALIGLERKITLFIFDQCQLSGEKITSAISIHHLCDYCQVPVSSAKRTIFTLQKKSIVLRVEYKNGRGGWTKYSLENDIYSEILQTETREKLRRNQRESGEKVVRKVESKLERALSSSSSINVLEDFTTTTTGETKKFAHNVLQLEKEWLEIDFSSLAEIHFGEAQLSQIAQIGRLSPEVVQDSIDAFAFDLKKNNKAKELKTAPLNFFMGILRRGMPYVPPENYESPQDEAVRKYIEVKRIQSDRRQAMQKERFELEFQEWKDTLSIVQRRELAPHAKIDGSEMQTATLKQYFKESIQNSNTDSGERSPDLQREIHKQIDQSIGLTTEGDTRIL